MKLKELLAKFRECNVDPESDIKIHVRVSTRRHTVAEVTPFDVDARGIWISLPENMHVAERKKSGAA